MEGLISKINDAKSFLLTPYSDEDGVWLKTASYMDIVLSSFSHSYTSESTIHNDVEYIRGEIYAILRLEALLMLAKEYELRIVYSE